MLWKNLKLLAKKGMAVRTYPTADRNASLGRLAVQALPYLLAPGGHALPPLSVFIHVNNRCNLHCSFCDYGNGNTDSMFFKNLAGGAATDMPIEHFRTIIDKVKRYKPFISMPAVEPLMYPHVVEAVEYARNSGLRVNLGSNGTPLRKKAEDLVRAGLSKIVISIDGPPAIHDDIRGLKGAFDKTIEGILALDEAKRKLGVEEPLVYINYVVSEANHRNLAECVRALPMHAIRQVDFRVVFFCTSAMAAKHNAAWGHRYDATTTNIMDEESLNRVDTDALWDEVQAVTAGHDGKCKFFFRHGREELDVYYHQPETFLDDSRCVHAWFMMQVNSDGTVIPAQRCYHQQFGNIVEQDFQAVWNGPAYRQFRRDLRKVGRFPACSRCEGCNF